MNEGLKKFEELLKTDEAFQKKLVAAMEAYDGEKTEEAVFNGVLVPLAQEYGISATFEELKEYLKPSETKELSLDEMGQVAGGKINGVGTGYIGCDEYGAGVGISWTSQGVAGCLVIGLGNDTTFKCFHLGEGESFKEEKMRRLGHT